MDSLSSSLMLGATLYRNQPGRIHKAVAEVGYAFVAVVAAVETVAALTFSAIGLVAHPFSPTLFNHSVTWLNSSVFSLGWSITDLFLNLVLDPLVADEKSARYFLNNGTLQRCPTTPINLPGQLR